MVVKGIVSAIYEEDKTLSVIFPEYNDIVTRPLKVYRKCIFREPCSCPSCDCDPPNKKVKVGDLVLVAVFNDDFNDCIVL